MNLKIVIVTFMCMTASSTFSQQTWFEDGAKWYHQLFSPWQGSGYETLRYEKDTTINNQTYKILKGDSYHTRILNTNPRTIDSVHHLKADSYVYQSGDTIWQYFLRNHIHIQLYNMSLSMGDTAHFMDLFLFAPGFGYATIVEDTSHIILNGSRLRTQRMGIYRDTLYYGKIDIIEKIGVANVPFHFFWYNHLPIATDQPAWVLKCYSDDKFPIIPFGESTQECMEWPQFITSLPDEQRSYFHITPNPIVDRASIRTNRKINGAELWSMTGQKIFDFQQLNDGDEIDFSTLTNGMYLLRVKSRGDSFSVKIVK